MSALSQAQSKLAVASRWNGPKSPEVIEARRDFVAAKIESFVGKVVADAPPLTPAQIDRISNTLRGDRR